MSDVSKKKWKAIKDTSWRKIKSSVPRLIRQGVVNASASVTVERVSK